MIITQQYLYSENKLIEAINMLSKNIENNPLYLNYKPEIEKNILWSKHQLSIDESTKVFLKHIHTYRALSYAFDIISSITLNEPVLKEYRHPHSELFLKHLIEESKTDKTNTTDLKAILNWVNQSTQNDRYNEKMIQRFEGGYIEALCYSYDKIQKELLNEHQAIKGR